MTAIERVVARARGELGYIEKASRKDLDDKTANAGSRNFTKYARDLDELGIYNGKKNGYDWCDVFADWCYIMEFGKDDGLKVICQPEKSYGAGVNSSAGYYKKQKRLDKNPAVGDQVYFIGSDGMYYHTGIVVAVDADTVTTIEGNAGKGSTQVVETVYKRSDKKLGAFGHPRWELVEDVPAAEPPKQEKPTEPEEAAPVVPAEPATIKLGDKVTLNAGAKVYGKDYEFSKWVYDRVLYVRGIRGDKVVISTQPEGDITGSVAMADVKLWGKAEKPTEKQPAAKPEKDTSAQEPVPFKVGDKVRVNNHAKNYSGTTEFSAWVYWRDMYIIQINDDRAVVSTKPNGNATGAVNVADLRLA